MKLSKRLESICALVDNKSSVADIGCDHGKVLLKLVKDNNAPYLIASDISAKSLNKAEVLLSKNGIDNYKTIVSNGLKSYSSQDVEVVDCYIIAGMGGNEIVDILSTALLQHKLLYKTFVLGAHNNVYKLRKFLVDNGFEIIVDHKVKDAHKYYDIIKCVYNNSYKQELVEDQLVYGITNLVQYNKDFIAYINDEIEKTNIIIEKTKGKTRESKQLKLNSLLLVKENVEGLKLK